MACCEVCRVIVTLYLKMHINVLVGAARPLAGLQGLSDYSVRCRVVYRDRTKSGPLQEVQAQFLRLYIAVLWRTCRY